jgi:SAM-dependent methyltransferase
MSTFDPKQYKITTRQQWEDAAGAWHRWGPTLEAWLGEATERMLDAARVGTASRVLDVAAGAGGQTILAARRVGPGGRVLATDISPTILTYAAKAAADAGLGNVETLEVDGEALDVLDPGSFDAVISRLGLIYFPDQQRALVGMRRGRCGLAAASRPSCTPRPSATSSSRSPCRSSAAAPTCPRHCPVSPDRSASAAPARSSRPSPPPGSTMSRSRP